ncbi:hypothetical protein EV649_2285 [Kribbella sp. VKM Ac-2569]|uniref:8-oxoguanine DNA glycosylase OGG fold protein n=1 Tax=Kribbella sp. VKM Ac-2569 TaxID=2512220 RepID=UPI00102BDC43|nr:hypothetical protein [Kribbella sp. VKM Ac-2569]RZT28508.1 hypothetical protein EV649_2285 [Kribbella sp. VKM Ac-2569]
MTDLRAAPPELLLAHERWTARGRPAQPAPHWFPHRWTARLPEHADFIETLPNPINRDDVAAQFVDADDSEPAALRAFLAAMIWGHGRNGYGAYRTASVLAASDRAGKWLSEALQVTRTAGGPAGFEYLARHRLKGLGVAFATKYLYFCLASDADVAPAPILDRIVRDWLAANLDWQPRLDWRIDDYQRYCDLVVHWSDQLTEPAGTVEYLMFASGIGTASQWADPRERVTATATSNSGTTAVLAALDDAADAFEALSGDITPEDAEDFERGLRALRRIVIARTKR